MSIILRKFNNKGVEAFIKFIEASRANNSIDELALNHLIYNDQFSETVDGLVIDKNVGPKKLDLAKYLSEKLNLKLNLNYYYDIGLWSWLSATYFPILIGKTKGGQLKFPKDNSLFVPITVPRNRWHRHLLAFPTWIYTDLGLKGKIYLRGP